MNPIDQAIAAIPLWLRLIPAIVGGVGLMIGIYATRKDVTR